jgi:hypothetical protein
VADAAYAYRLLDMAWACTPEKLQGDNSRRDALWLGRHILETFVCDGDPSSARCALARKYVSKNVPGEDMTGHNEKRLPGSLTRDIEALAIGDLYPKPFRTWWLLANGRVAYPVRAEGVAA